MIHVELLLWQGLSTLNINNLIHYRSVAVSVFSLCFTSPFSIRSGISTASQGPSWSGGKEGEEEEGEEEEGEEEEEEEDEQKLFRTRQIQNYCL